jgi:hypothetical protein
MQESYSSISHTFSLKAPVFSAAEATGGGRKRKAQASTVGKARRTLDLYISSLLRHAGNAGADIHRMTGLLVISKVRM